MDKSTCFEGICNSGELIFVPSGWWHAVINLETTIAITQNFVCQHNLLEVLDFLKTKPDQISGTCKTDLLYSKLYSAIKSKHPELLEISKIEKKNLFSHSSTAESFKFTF